MSCHHFRPRHKKWSYISQNVAKCYCVLVTSIKLHKLHMSLTTHDKLKTKEHLGKHQCAENELNPTCLWTQRKHLLQPATRGKLGYTVTPVTSFLTIVFCKKIRSNSNTIWEKCYSVLISDEYKDVSTRHNTTWQSGVVFSLCHHFSYSWTVARRTG